MKVTTHLLGGRRVGQFIDLKSLDTNATVKEAIDKTAFAALAAADDGKEIVFTVKGCYNKATKSGVVKYVAPLKHVTVDAFTATYEAGTESTSASVTVGNPDGINGYTSESGVEHASAKAYVNGTDKGTVELVGSGTHVFSGTIPGATTGDTVKIVFTIDPAKTDFDQTPAEGETTVVAP